MDRKRIGIVIYEEVEVLDFCGPFEVFSVTRLREEKRREETSPFQALLDGAPWRFPPRLPQRAECRSCLITRSRTVPLWISSWSRVVGVSAIR